MAATYKIERVLSVGRKGKMMVSVRIGNKTVTRHLVNGRGRHPDDTIPALHLRLDERVDLLQEQVEKLTKGITAAEKEIEKSGPQAEEARFLLPIARLARLVKEQKLSAAIAAREQEAIENPLYVDYWQEAAR